MGKGRMRRLEAKKKAKKLILSTLAISQIDPAVPVICSADEPLDGILEDFFGLHCMSCGFCAVSSEDLDRHNSSSYDSRKVCERCKQVVENLDYHELNIPKRFHHLFKIKH